MHAGTRQFSPLLIAFVVFTVLTVVMTAPFSWRFTDHLFLNNDSYSHVWRLAWTAHQLASDPGRLFEANTHYPVEHTLALSDAMPLLSFAATPFIWAGVHPVTVHNLLLLFAFVTSGVGMFVLAFEITGAMVPSLLAGMMFTFASQRFGHVGQIELMWTCWMPLSLWALYRLMRDGRLVFGVWLGAFVALQGLSCLYYLVFLGLYLAIVGLASIDRAPAELWKRRIVALISAGATMAVLIGPYLAAYSQMRTGRAERNENAARRFSASFQTYARVLPENRLYVFLRRGQDSHERSLFPGALAIALAGVGLWKGPRRLTVVCVAGLLFALFMSLGVNGWLFPLARTLVPPLQDVRAPARFAILVQMSIALLAAMGGASLLTRPSLRRAWVTLALFCVLALEYASMPIDMIKPTLEAPPMARWLASQPAGSATAILPVHQFEHDPRFMYLSIFHWQPMVNGYSSFMPQSYVTTRDLLGTFPDVAAVKRLQDLRISFVVLSARDLGEPRYSDLLRTLREHPAFGDPVVFDDAAFPSAAFPLR